MKISAICAGQHDCGTYVYYILQCNCQVSKLSTYKQISETLFISVPINHRLYSLFLPSMDFLELDKRDLHTNHFVSCCYTKLWG